MISWMVIFNSFGAELKDLQIALESPAPTMERFKLVSGEWVLHNGFREREIKTKLFSCKTRLTACDKYKELARDFKPEVKTYLFKNQTLVIAGFAVSFSIGLSLGVFLLGR